MTLELREKLVKLAARAGPPTMNRQKVVRAFASHHGRFYFIIIIIVNIIINTLKVLKSYQYSLLGNPINGGPKFLYHVKHSAKPDTNHSTNPTNPNTKYRV